jgi:hypothetical protein
MRTMTRYALVAAIALSTAPLFAGVRIQTDKTDLATNKATSDQILLDADRMRIDSGDGRSVLFLTDGGRSRMVMLDKTKNTYQEIDEQMMKQMGEQMSGMSAQMAQMEAQMKSMPPEQRAMMEKMMKGKMPQPAAAVPKTVYTAKGSGSVNGFSCTKYEGALRGEKVADVCAAGPAQLKLTAADFQVLDKMKQFSASLTSALANSPMRASVPTSSGFESGYEGFPIQKVTFEGGKATEREELKSITRASFSDADFSLGSAKKVEMPMPGARGKQR